MCRTRRLVLGELPRTVTPPMTHPPWSLPRDVIARGAHVSPVSDTVSDQTVSPASGVVRTDDSDGTLAPVTTAGASEID